MKKSKPGTHPIKDTEELIKHIQRHPDQTWKKFLQRTISAQLHLLGFIAAAIGLGFLLYHAWPKLEPVHFWTCLIFGVTSLFVFGVSTVYHFLSDGYRISNKLNLFMEDLDHTAIYLFIAGTYTPFIINVFEPPWDTILMIMIWSIGAAGILYTHFKSKLPKWAQHRFFSTAIFVMMGWTLLVRLPQAIDQISPLGFFLLAAGGFSYTIGAAIYATKWPNPLKDIFGFHEIWHIFVMMGFGFHYFLILNFYITTN